MTYRELFNLLSELEEEELDMDVTIYMEAFDEYFKVHDFDKAVGDDVLHDGHPVLISNG